MSPSFSFDGREIPFAEGQTIAAALVAAGTYSWRTTRGSGRPRGVFCGIGVCFDCLLVVDGRADTRACLAPATPGAVVGSQTGAGHDDLAV